MSGRALVAVFGLASATVIFAAAHEATAWAITFSAMQAVLVFAKRGEG